MLSVGDLGLVLWRCNVIEKNWNGSDLHIVPTWSLVFGTVRDGAAALAGRAEEARRRGGAAVPATCQLFVPGTLRTVIYDW